MPALPTTILPNLVLVAFALLTACTKYEYKPQTITESVPGYVRGEWREASDSTFTPFQLELGYDPLLDLRWFMNTEFGVDAGYKTLTTGFASPRVYGISGDNFALACRFWLPPMGNNNTVTPAELEDFFAVGKTFAFGSGSPDRMDFMLRLPFPSEQGSGVANSRASYLLPELQQGILTVTGLTDYTPTLPTTTNRSGKLLHCTFSGLIGRVRIPATGLPNQYRTSEAVEIQNGEAVFYLAYTP